MAIFKYPDPTPVLPTLNGFSIHQIPTFSTIIHTSVSGRETQIGRQAYPLWAFTLNYEELKSETQNQTLYSRNSPDKEFEQIILVFLACAGAYGRFYFDCQNDNSRAAQAIATGDGTTQSFRLKRTWGFGDLAFTEPVGGVNTVSAVYLNGVSQASGWTIDDDNQNIEFTTAPGAGVAITIDFSYYYRCRFLEDIANFDQFYTNLWELKSFKFRSVKD